MSRKRNRYGRGPGFFNHPHEHDLSRMGISYRDKFNYESHPSESSEEREAKFKRMISQMNEKELEKFLNEIKPDESFSNSEVEYLEEYKKKYGKAKENVPEDIIEKCMRVIKDNKHQYTQQSISANKTGFQSMKEDQLDTARKFLERLPRSDRRDDVIDIIKVEANIRTQLKRMKVPKGNNWKRTPEKPMVFSSGPEQTPEVRPVQVEKIKVQNKEAYNKWKPLTFD